MTPAPEAEVRQKIDQLLETAGWVVQDYKAANAAIQELKRRGKVRQTGERRGARYILRGVS